ncbi:MAG: 30S ribosomal protein S6 [Clostridia bacterium]|nr:30S ribosomal protein S6 [Clostridia bacterium]
MNKYEMLYIIKNDITDEAKQEVVDKMAAVITSNGGEIESTDKWGTKKYAYPIDYTNEGYYVLVNFTAPATVPEELKRMNRITDEIVRSMIIKK